MKKIFFLLNVIFLFFSSSFIPAAKDDFREQCEKAKSRILLVILEDSSNVDTVNALLQKIINKQWTFNDTIIFKTRKDAEQLLATKTDKYLVLQFVVYKIWSAADHMESPEYSSKGLRPTGSNPSGFYKVDKAMTATAIPKTKKIKFNENPNQSPGKIWKPYDVFEVDLSEKYTFDNGYVFSYELFLGNKRNEANLTVHLKILQSILNTSDKNALNLKWVKGNFPELKNKTLLLQKNILADKLTEEKIKEIYPYPYKIVDEQEIENAIINSDEKSAVILIESDILGNFSHRVIVCNNGLALSYWQGRGVKINGISSVKFQITESSLKGLADL